MSDSHLFCDNSDNDILVMTFASFQLNVGGVPKFEFFNYLSKNYSQYDHSFFIDSSYCWYNKGLEGISSNVSETVSYINEHTKDYRKVIYMGTSAGGYAAMLYGSLCSGNNKVIAIVPQTDLQFVYDRRNTLPPFVQTDWDNISPEYMDLKPHMRDDVYYRVGGNQRHKDTLHHSHHMRRVYDLPSVHKFTDGGDMRKLRDSGVFARLLDDCIAAE